MNSNLINIKLKNLNKTIKKLSLLQTTLDSAKQYLTGLEKQFLNLMNSKLTNIKLKNLNETIKKFIIKSTTDHIRFCKAESNRPRKTIFESYEFKPDKYQIKKFK